MDESTVFGDDTNIFAESMLERGFYPENLPPVFAIENFHEAAITYIIDQQYIAKKPTECCVYNASKRGGSRRNFEMPNPLFMIDASTFFSKHKSAIYEHFQVSDDSLSVPTFYDEGRPARITNFANVHRDRRKRLATSRYIVRTDISRYFHSIYTHSLPWALHGKDIAKKDRSVDSASAFANRLDQIFRQAKDGQTVGIPVGPDYSRYASEIIGKAIDTKFRERIGDQCVFIRHVDDIYIGANDHDSANQYLSAIQEAVQYFQLDLNDRKTSVVPTNLDLEPFWPVRIRREIESFGEQAPGEKSGSVGHDFVYFLDEIIRIANSENDDGVVKFALRKMDESGIWSAYWNIVEPFLIRVAINFPHSWDYVARIASWRERVYGLEKSLWGDVVNNSLARQAVSGNDSEVTWALWLAKEAKLQIDLQVLESVLDRCGAISSLLAIDVYFSNRHKYAFPKAKFLDRIGEQPMLGPNWLLAYEADRLFDLKIKTRNLNGYNFSKDLYENNTQFYDRNAVPSVFLGVEDPSDIEAALEDVVSHYDENFEEIDDEDDEVVF